jgi:predicted lipoprotein
MTTTSRRRSPVRPWMVAAVAAVAVLVLAGFSTKVVSTEEAAAGQADQFDAATYAADHYAADIVPYIEENAVPLTELLEQLNGGADEADFGNTSGASSAYAFPVTFTAVAGDPTPPVLPVTVEGVPAETTVQLQIGPAVTGTAIRDVSGTVSFNEFTNQLEYQNVGTELNNQVKASLLDSLDPATLAGKTITVTGAFLRVNPALVSVVPISIEVAP